MATLKIKVVVQFLQNNGFEKVAQSGSHWKLFNPNSKKSVILPVHGPNQDIPIGTLMHIIKQSGIDKSQWPLPENRPKKR